MDWLLVAARTVHFAATISLAGVAAFECMIAVPVFAGAGHGGAVAAQLRRQLEWLAWASLVLAIISGAAWLLAVASAMSGEAPVAALLNGEWEIVLTRTQFGEAWLVRCGLAAGIAVCLAVGRRGGPVEAPVRWAALLFAAPLLAALAWAGHGAATPGEAGEVHLVGDILHLLGAGGWIGTLLPFALLLIAVRRGYDPLRLTVAGRAARRFSVLAFGSVALLLAGGIINTWFLAGTIPALVGTGYGRLLLAKIAVFLATLVIAAVNLLRLSPRLTTTGTHALSWMRRNALAEAALGLAVLAVVAVLGTLPPGLHTEPAWPFPYRVAFAALGHAARRAFALFLAVAGGASIATVAFAAAGRHRAMAGCGVAVIAAAGAAWSTVQPALEPAYPTSFYASAEPYAAPSIVAGAALYAVDCALCHGAGGEGDGPAAANLSVRPANLTLAPLVAQTPGDLFWWVSNGRDDGAMPGFAAVMTARQRWDVINFVRARAAAVLARGIGATITAAAAPAFPDFAFESGGSQSRLGRALRQGPVLLALFAAPAVPAHVAALIKLQPRLAAGGLRVIAVDVAAPAAGATGVVRVSPEIAPALALFRDPGDGEETDLLLDRNGDIRARFTASGKPGLPDAATIIADARRMAAIPIAAPSHAGHVE